MAGVVGVEAVEAVALAVRLQYTGRFRRRPAGFLEILDIIAETRQSGAGT